MRAVVQVVTGASVTVDGAVVAELRETGLVVLLGVTHADTRQTSARLASKVWNLRILGEGQSASELRAGVVVVSQFTLYGDTSRGRRPGWSAAAPRQVAEPLVNSFTQELRRLGAHAQTGVFGAHMLVHLVNDGPRTILLEM